jgi:hypothetical protein
MVNRNLHSVRGTTQDWYIQNGLLCADFLVA